MCSPQVVNFPEMQTETLITCLYFPLTSLSHAIKYFFILKWLLLLYPFTEFLYSKTNFSFWPKKTKTKQSKAKTKTFETEEETPTVFKHGTLKHALIFFFKNRWVTLENMGDLLFWNTKCGNLGTKMPIRSKWLLKFANRMKNSNIILFFSDSTDVLYENDLISIRFLFCFGVFPFRYEPLPFSQVKPDSSHSSGWSDCSHVSGWSLSSGWSRWSHRTWSSRRSGRGPWVPWYTGRSGEPGRSRGAFWSIRSSWSRHTHGSIWSCWTRWGWGWRRWWWWGRWEGVRVNILFGACNSQWRSQFKSFASIS